jgi:hypothetical protein
MSELEKKIPKLPLDPSEFLSAPLNFVRDFDSMLNQIDSLLKDFDRTLTHSDTYIHIPPPATTAKPVGELPKKGESIDYCIECLPSSTLIYTGNSVKKISSVTERHTVIGHTGRIESVVKTFKRPYEGDLVEVEFWYTNIPLRLTPEHPIYGVRNVRKPQSTWRKEGIDESQLEWIPAQELIVQDFIAFPRIREVKDVGLASEDLMELAGLYIAEGCFVSRSRNISVTFSFGKDEKELIERASTLIEKVFGVKPCVTDTDSQTTVRVVLTSKYYASFFEQFGKGARNKTIPNWVLYLPESKQYRLLRGMFQGDGSKTKYSLRYYTASVKLAYRLRLLLFRLGILHTLSERKVNESKISGRLIKPKGKIYEIEVSGDSARILAEKMGIPYDGGERTTGNFGFVSENYVFIPVKAVKKVPFKGFVYNLHVNDSESYLTVHGALHNCAIKHSQTAKVLMREAIQRAVAGSPSDPGVLEKVRGVVEELVGFEDDTMSAKDEKVLALNAAARALRRMIYSSGAEIGRASLDDLKKIKEMIDKLVDATYEVRASCTPCEVERICGSNLKCLEFLEEAVKKAKSPEDIKKALEEAEKIFKSRVS